MPITVYRHQIPPFKETNVFEVSLHGGASVIHVDQIRVPRMPGREHPTWETDANDKFEYFLWAVEDTQNPVEKRKFWYVRDGDDLSVLGENAAFNHVVTFRSTDGMLWCHVFDITHLPFFEPPKRIGPAEFRRRGPATEKGPGSGGRKGYLRRRREMGPTATAVKTPVEEAFERAKREENGRSEG